MVRPKPRGTTVSSEILRMVSRLETGTGFVEPKRMHALHFGGEHSRIRGSELSVSFKGEIGGWGGGTHRFEACGSDAHKLAALIAGSGQGNGNEETQRNPR